MRNFMDIISKQVLAEARERTPRKAPDDSPAPRPAQTAEKPKFDFMPDLEVGGKAVAKTGAKARAPATTLPGRKASGSRTRRAATQAGAAMMAHPGAADAMHGILGHGMDDEISDAEAAQNAGFAPTDMEIGADRPVPNLENLPAIINHEIALTGGAIEPEWHQIKHLPGYLVNQIRQVGRAVFREFTDTPIEDIQLLFNLNAQPGMPHINEMNSEAELRAAMTWIRHNGVPEGGETEMRFGPITAQVRLWNTEDFSFLLVRDFLGTYVYGWCSKNGVHLGGDDRKRLTQA